MFSSGDLPAYTKVTLPALSPTMELGTIVSWEKKEGDKLNEGDLLAEIETDKATMGFETPEEGYLAKILIPAGTKDIPIGKVCHVYIELFLRVISYYFFQLLCIIVAEESEVAAFANFVSTETDTKPTSSAPSAPPPPASKPVSVTATSATPIPSPTAVSQTSPSKSSGGRIFASPFAKKVAAEKGLDLSKVVGTGPNGRIRSIDLAGAPSLQASAAGASFGAPISPYVDAELTNMRQVIAKRLLLSKQTIPHYYLTTEINVDELLK